MKKYIPKVIMVVFALFIVSCNSQKKITKISYDVSSGGKGNSYSRLEITKEQIYYVNGNYKSKKDIKEKTTKEVWNNITNSIDYDDFFKVKSHPGRMAYDGSDVTISISFGNEIFSVVNGEVDTLNFKKIKLFVSSLENQKSVFYQKCNFKHPCHKK
jgi:hypothetical protein